MRFENGNTFGQGRPPGSPNKPKQSIYEIYSEVFELMGGISRFKEWAEKNPNQFYNLHSKLVPLEVKLGGSASSEFHLSLGVVGEKLINNVGIDKGVIEKKDDTAD